ncbi:VOC family protein [Dendronalium sp. ChiSLP03b]|uniref:VOC family protein n=1 Tax=Dendronalium sp. ChiSLP03b TaxID=3075381 RepID=UPI002AD43222|nr:VOC family protein [Dendronalium sp. ChiSLP03b]MDZ8206475.1 VOC family protein [Dendronalium sp. ChiSLP03b]
MKQMEEIKVWLNAIDHIQVTSSPEAENAMLFFYSQVLGLTEITKPEALQANGGAWYLLGDIQIHVGIEKQINNQVSRRHICFRVHSLEAFAIHLQAHGVENISDRQSLPEYNRFFIRDPGGNRIEIAEFAQHKTDS